MLRKVFKTVLVTSLLAGGASSMAETGSSTTTTPAPAAFSPSLIGNIDLRPSFIGNTGEFYTENSIELGAKLAPKVAVSYVQAFNSNIYARGTENDGIGLNMDRGFLRAKISKILESDDKKDSLSYEARVYTPTREADRTNGMVTLVRNYLKYNHEFSSVFNVTVADIVIPMIYTRAGTPSAKGGTANPAFENRVYLIPTVNLTSKLSFTAPIMFHQTKYRDFGVKAKNNDSWKFFVWTYPELDYTLTENLSVGIAYYSDNLVSANLDGVNIGDGLRNGIFQVAFMANL